MAQKITLTDGVLDVPDDPIIPFIEGDGTGVDIWPASQLVLDAAAKKHGKTIEWKEVLAGQKAFDATGDWLPEETVAGVPRPPHRDQGPAHDARGRRHPQPQRRAAPDHGPLRVPAAGALVHGRAVAGEAPREGRHGDLPGEHRGHLRRPRGRGRHSRGEAADRDAQGRVRVGDQARLGHRHQARLGERLEAPHPRRDPVRGAQEPQERAPRAQGQHHEVHRGRVPQWGYELTRDEFCRRRRRAGTTAAATRATRSS